MGEVSPLYYIISSVLLAVASGVSNPPNVVGMSLDSQGQEEPGDLSYMQGALGGSRTSRSPGTQITQ